jgi:hypothetical protein
MAAKMNDSSGKPLPHDHPLKGTNIIIGGLDGFDPTTMSTPAPVPDAIAEPTHEFQKPPSKLAGLYKIIDRAALLGIMLCGFSFLLYYSFELGFWGIALWILVPASGLFISLAVSSNEGRIRSKAPLLTSIWDRRAATPVWFIIKAAILAYLVIYLSEQPWI